MDNSFPFEHFLTPGIANPTPFLDSTKENTPSGDCLNKEEIVSINAEILDYLKSNIPDQKFTTYFENTFSLSSITKDHVEFTVTTQFIKTMLDKHYLSKLEEAIICVLGQTYSVSISVNSSVKSLSSNDNNILNTINQEKMATMTDNLFYRDTTSTKQPSKNASFSLDLNPRAEDLIQKAESKSIAHINNGSITNIDRNKTFTNFIIGPSNNYATAAAMAVSEKPGRAGRYPSLYIYSDSGLGKTHLLHSIGNAIAERHPALSVMFITARYFMNDLVDATRANKINEFRKKYSDRIDVLMIDDIHELKSKEATQNEFFHIFNELHNKGKQLVFTSDKTPNEIDGIEERIKTRLQWGLVIDIQRPDFETRLAILKKKANELDLYLSDDVLNLIASNIKNNIRELEGALIKLSAFSDFSKREIDILMAKEILRLESDENDKNLSLATISKEVSKFYRVQVADLKSKSRTKEFAYARFVAMYLSQKLLNATLVDIGRFYGDRDHTSVLHAIRKITGDLKTDNRLSQEIVAIENLF